MFEDNEFTINIKYSKNIKLWKGCMTSYNDSFGVTCIAVNPGDVLIDIAQYFYENINFYKPKVTKANSLSLVVDNSGEKDV